MRLCADLNGVPQQGRLKTPKQGLHNLGWSWLDPVMGLVGTGLVAVRANGLVVETSKVLPDLTPASLRSLLAIHEEVVHATMEIHHGPEAQYQGGQ